MPSAMVNVYETYAEASAKLSQLIKHRFGTDPDVQASLTIRSLPVTQQGSEDKEIALVAYPIAEGPESARFVCTMVGSPRLFLAEFLPGELEAGDPIKL